jgi:type I restriction enzyme S subunit
MEVRRGYKQTDIGIFPENWAVQPLVHCCDYADYRGKTPPKTPSGIFLITARNVRKGFIDYEESKEYVATNQYELIMRRGKPHIGDVLITTEAPLGNVAQIDREDVALAQRIIKYRPKNFNLSSKYLKHYLLSDRFQAILDGHASGSTAKGIKGSVLHQLPVVIPPRSEQDAIAEVLGDADALIESLEQLIVKKRQIKQGAMQELLTGKRRLPGYAQEWTVKSLGEIGESLIGLTYKPSEVRTDGFLVLRSSNIFQGALCFEDNVYVAAEFPEKIMVRPGDILICVRNGSRDLIGKCAKIDDRAKGMTFGAFMAVFRTAYHSFVYHQFQSSVIIRQIQEHLGATINQITNKSLNSFRIPFPLDFLEQNAVASVLDDMDAEITTLGAKLAKVRLVKQGMTQELLTGRIRLV